MGTFLIFATALAFASQSYAQTASIEVKEDGSALVINGGDTGKIDVKGDIVVDGGLSVGGVNLLDLIESNSQDAEGVALKTLLARLQADQARMQLELETQQKDHVEQQGVITKLQTDLDEQVAKTADATDRVKALETAASDAPPVVKKKAFPITVVPA
eukprot:gene30654-31750_t